MKISFSGIFWGLICVGIGLFFLAGGWWSYSEYKHVQDYSGKTIGHVTKKHFKLGSDGGGNYFIDYWFMSSTSGKINSSSVIAKQQWDMLKPDDAVEIRYDPSNLNRNIPMCGGSPSLLYAFFMLVLASVFMLFGSLRFISGFKKSSQGK